MAVNPVVRTAEIVADTSTTAQTLPNSVLAARVTNVIQNVSGTPTALTVVSGTPSSGDAQFAGTPDSPSGTVTLSADPATDTVLIVEYQLPGDLPADQ